MNPEPNTPFDLRPDNWLNRVGGLPDPDTDPQFYDGVPAKRLLAFAIDIILIWGAVIAFSLVTLGLGFLIFGLLLPVADFFYRVLTLSSRSATFGMRTMGIELRGSDGAQFGPGQAILHTLMFYLSVGLIVVQFISVILMAGSSLGRGLHDLPLGSTMINSPA